MRTTEAVAHVKHSNIRAYVHLPTQNAQLALRTGHKWAPLVWRIPQ